MGNPFVKASKKKKHLKIGVYGGPGVGKTYFGLGFPKPAVIDLEGSTDLYGDRFNFSVLDTKSFAKIMEAVKFLETGKHDFETLVIDPVTVIWSALQDGRLEWKSRLDIDKTVAGGNYKDDFNFKDWGQLKRLNSMLMTKLVNLKMHLVLIGRMKDEYIEKGDKRIKTGVKMDAEKSLPYLPDICFRLEAENEHRIAIFEKDRSGFFPQGKKVENISFKDFLPIFNKTMDGEEVSHQVEDDAASKDAEFFQKTENGENEFHPQSQPAKSAPKPINKPDGTPASNNSGGYTLKGIFASFGELGLSAKFQELFKRYCYHEYGVDSMTKLTQENLATLNKNLGVLRNDKRWIPDFKEKLLTFKKLEPEPQSKPTSADKDPLMAEAIYSKLKKACDEDSIRMTTVLRSMTGVDTNIEDLKTMTNEQLEEIAGMVEIVYSEWQEKQAQANSNADPFGEKARSQAHQAAFPVDQGMEASQ